MKISVEWLTERKACAEAVEKFREQEETDSIKLIKKMIKKKHLDWASWLITRTMSRPQCLAYAIYSAEQVIDIFKKKYPDDKRPQNALVAAKAVLKNDNEKTRAAAEAAGAAIWAAWTAEVAGAAIWAVWTAEAAWTAARAAGAAAGVVWTAEAAWAAARAAGAAAGAAMQIKILKYGLKLLRRNKCHHRVTP